MTRGLFKGWPSLALVRLVKRRIRSICLITISLRTLAWRLAKAKERDSRENATIFSAERKAEMPSQEMKETNEKRESNKKKDQQTEEKGSDFTGLNSLAKTTYLALKNLLQNPNNFSPNSRPTFIIYKWVTLSKGGRQIEKASFFRSLEKDFAPRVHVTFLKFLVILQHTMYKSYRWK